MMTADEVDDDGGDADDLMMTTMMMKTRGTRMDARVMMTRTRMHMRQRRASGV